MNDEDLKGRYVLVHPDLKDDPAEKSGEIGMITVAEHENDLARVKFDDERRGLYAMNALLIFRPSDLIYDQLKQNATLLSPQNFKDLKNIALLLDYGRPEQTRTAMRIVLENPDLLQMSMETLEENLGLARQQKIGR